MALSKDRDTQIEKLKEEHSSQISALKLSVLVKSINHHTILPSFNVFEFRFFCFSSYVQYSY